MRFLSLATAAALAIGAAGCGQSNSDNVMSPDANALQPADVNLALGPETTNSDLNAAANGMNAMHNPADENSAEPVNNSSE